MSIKEYKRIIKKIYSDFKKKYPEEYKRQVEIQKKADEEFFNRLKAERSNDEYLNDIDLLQLNIQQKIGAVILGNHTKSWSSTHPHLDIIKEPKDE